MAVNGFPFVGRDPRAAVADGEAGFLASGEEARRQERVHEQRGADAHRADRRDPGAAVGRATVDAERFVERVQIAVAADGRPWR